MRVSLAHFSDFFCTDTLLEILQFENGPCKVDESGDSTSVNPHSWTESAHVLWLDQPANVGYSYGQANDANEKMISEDVYYFLQVRDPYPFN